MLICAATTASLQPGVPLAVPAALQPEPDLAAFDRAFRLGQDEFNGKRYLDAARIWVSAARILPKTEAHQENRRAIY